MKNQGRAIQRRKLVKIFSEGKLSGSILTPLSEMFVGLPTEDQGKTREDFARMILEIIDKTSDEEEILRLAQETRNSFDE